MTFAEQLMVYQGNIIPLLLDKLAQQLRVSVKSLTSLGVGYALQIPLKDGKRFFNCWTFPERDEHGDIIGLSLRQWDGQKWMVPGSKHGLIYVPNIHRSNTQQEQYQAGPQNWVRTTTETPCPICNKPDWCLVSAEDPDDPRAVLCGRVKEGASKDMGTAGYLHIRKDTGDLAPENMSVLPPSNQPILIVEGATDTAAALDLGFVAVGRPSHSGCLDKLPALVAGRSVIIVGDNDAGVGREGMEKTFEILQPHVKSAVKLLPPEGVKDLRQWVGQGLTRGQFQRIVRLTGSTTETNLILPSIAPLDLARQWLNTVYCKDGMYVLRIYHNTWYAYTGQRYEEISRSALRQMLYQFLDGKQFKKLRPNGFDILNYDPTKRKIDEIIDALLAFCPIASENIPCWIGNKYAAVDPKKVLVFPNGWLNIDEYLQPGEFQFHELTPQFFSLASYPYAFDPDATCNLWKKFLNQLFPTDPTKIALLQEWFGYNLIPDNSQEKFMMFLGPTRGGKSTVLSVLACILGESQVIATSLRNLSQRFGLFSFFGKLAALVGDVSAGTNYDATEALNRLKQITGNDAVCLERKGMDITQTNVKLYARFTLAANAMPRFPDYSRTIESRILLVPFDISFAGREDITLKARLKAEAPGIMLWALNGLKRLQRQRTFTLPASHTSALRRVRGETTPILDFVEDNCEFGKSADHYITCEHLYECWKDWAIANGERHNSNRWLSRVVQSMFSHCTLGRIRINSTRKRVFYGVKLQEEAAKRYGSKR